MARTEVWRNDVADAIRREAWSLTGPRRVVKVVPTGRPTPIALGGFVCLEMSLLGKTPSAIALALGLPQGLLSAGCRIFRFTRLPLSCEVEYELSALHPDGLAFNPVMHDGSYPPGSAAVHQWRLLVDIPAELLLELAPGAAYPYLHR